jgi:hypothetical protein
MIIRSERFGGTGSGLNFKRFHPNFIFGCQAKLNGYLTLFSQGIAGKATAAGAFNSS